MPAMPGVGWSLAWGFDVGDVHREGGPSPVARLQSRITRQFSSGEARQLTTFATALLARGGAVYAERLSDDDLMAVVAGTSAFFTRAGAVPRARLRNPRAASDGWDSPHTIVEVVVRDGPFIVETIRGFLERRGLVVRFLLHPVFGVTRERDGGLTVLGDNLADGTSECFAYAAIDPRPNAEELAGIARDLGALLDDIDCAGRDRRAVAERLEATAQDLEWVATRPGGRLRSAEIAEAVAFLRWLAAGNLLPVGYREDRNLGGAVGIAWEAMPESAIGILGRPHDGDDALAAAPATPGEHRPLVSVGKTRIPSPFYPFDPLDVVSVEVLAPDGHTLGARRFVGAWTRRARLEDATVVPMLRRMFDEILAAETVAVGSHDARMLADLFNGFPKQVVFGSNADEMLGDIRAVLDTRPDRVSLAARPFGAGGPDRRLAVLVSAAGHGVSREAVERVGRLIAARADGTVAECQLADVGAERTAIHVVVVAPGDSGGLASAELLREVTTILRPEAEELARALGARRAEAEALDLAARYGGIFPAGYAERVGAALVATHVERFLEVARSGSLQLDLEPADGGRFALRIYGIDESLVHGDLVGLIDRCGLSVHESERIRVELPEGGHATLHAFVLEDRERGAWDPVRVRPRLAALVRAVVAGLVADDRLNRLLLTTDLDMQAVNGLRLLVAYGQHLGFASDRDTMQRALIAHPRAATALTAYFRARFALESADDPTAMVAAVHARAAEIESSTTTRIIRSLAAVVEAVVRTTAFDPEEGVAAIKVDSGLLPVGAGAIPTTEIFVHGATVEAFYARLGRGGHGPIVERDDVEGLRTDVLDRLVVAAVKGAGAACAPAYGAFTVKGAGPLSATTARTAYVRTLRAVLRLLDNGPGGDDALMVVAADAEPADRVEATRDVARQVGWWLGDALVSGRTPGWDHEVSQLGGRGAWECVQAHLREAGRIVDDPVVVVGAGDMTDEFFAAGMVQSPAIRLRAAVSRRYFFLDPDPDPEASLGERRRLAQQRLGWEAYDATKLSKGGMILARTATRVQLSPEARGLLGLDAHEISGEQLAEAILGAKADVLWAGAGANAVAAPRRTGHARTAPALVLGPHEVRAAVIAGGDVSALDPKMRVDFARTGIRMSSYAIDGIADADFGDHEATLKILLAVAQADGVITDSERETLLRDAVGHVVPRVLARVRAAHRALSYDERRARVHGLEYLDAIAEARAVDGVAAAAPEFPDAAALAARRAGAPIITRPELSVLLACGKRALREDLLAAAAPLDGPVFQRFLVERFSRGIHERFRNAVRAHPLCRELVAAELATEIVDTMGAAFVRRLGRDFHLRPAAIAHAWMSADALADGRSLRAALWTGPAESSTPNDANTTVAQYDALANALERLTVWVLEYTAAQPGTDPIAEFGHIAEELRRRLPVCFSAPEAERFHQRAAALDMAGDHANLARRLALAEALADGFDLVAIAAGIHAPWESVARLYYAAGDWLEYSWIERGIAALNTDDPWRHRAAFALGQDLRAARRRLVGRLGAVGASVAEVQAGGCAGEMGESLAVDIRALRGSGRGDLAALAVVVRELGRLGDAIHGG